MQRVAVIGCLGSGKTMIARRVAAAIGTEVVHPAPHREVVRRNADGLSSMMWFETRLRLRDNALRLLPRIADTASPEGK